MKKLLRGRSKPSCHLVAFSALLAALATGCGNAMVSHLLASQTLYFSECGDEIEPLPADLVALDWSGGTSPIFRGKVFPGLDLSLFETTDGGTLAETENSFKEDVRRQVTRIYCESASVRIRVVDAQELGAAPATLVLYTQALSPRGSGQIGEGEYDPCDHQHDNSAVIFGEQVRLLGGPRPYEEWVAAFANVTAHEIGHTLGFPHVNRDDHPELSRSLYIELMLASHTPREIVRELRFVVDQTNCPSDTSDAPPSAGSGEFSRIDWDP